MLLASVAFAAPKLSPKPQGAEIAFVTHIQQTLGPQYPTPGAAAKAGYFRYTNEDDTGSISYANLQWTSADWNHPSQLWYDVHGNLLGADFSVPHTKKPPSLWGINPARWTYFEEHIHYILNSNGKTIYGYEPVKKFTAAGGSLSNPQPATLVKMHVAKSASQVQKIFVFPAIWDLVVWIKPNPKGAFSWKNPLVHPSTAAHSSM